MHRYLLQDKTKAGSHLSIIPRHIRRHIPLHWHDYIELELVTGGHGRQNINGQPYDISRGSMILLRHTDFHELLPDPELYIINLAVDESFLSQELLAHLTADSTLMFELEESETQTMERLLGLCMEEEAADDPNKEYLQHLLACILLRILKLVPDQQEASEPQSRSLEAVLLHLHMHFRENPSLSKLATLTHYNVSHFCTLFHQKTGMTYTQYLNMLKTDYAKKLLLATQLKISEICQECGFTSHSNFLRLFRQETGLSPAAFRKQKQAKYIDV